MNRAILFGVILIVVCPTLAEKWETNSSHLVDIVKRSPLFQEAIEAAQAIGDEPVTLENVENVENLDQNQSILMQETSNYRTQDRTESISDSTEVSAPRSLLDVILGAAAPSTATETKPIPTDWFVVPLIQILKTLVPKLGSFVESWKPIIDPIVQLVVRFANVALKNLWKFFTNAIINLMTPKQVQQAPAPSPYVVIPKPYRVKRQSDPSGAELLSSLIKLHLKRAPKFVEAYPEVESQMSQMDGCIPSVLYLFEVISKFLTFLTGQFFPRFAIMSNALLAFWDQGKKLVLPSLKTFQGGLGHVLSALAGPYPPSQIEHSFPAAQ